MSETETFGQMLKRLRDARGWTLREAADRLGISFPYLSQLEAGVAKRPSEDLAKKIAEVFGENQEKVMFLARNIPAELEEIMRKYPTTSQPYFKPSHFRRGSKREGQK